MCVFFCRLHHFDGYRGAIKGGWILDLGDPCVLWRGCARKEDRDGAGLAFAGLVGCALRVGGSGGGVSL